MRELSTRLKTVSILCAFCLACGWAMEAKAADYTIGSFDDLLQYAEGSPASGDTLSLTSDLVLGKDISLGDGVTVKSNGGPFTVKSNYHYQPKYGFTVGRGMTTTFQDINLDEISFNVDLGDTDTAAGKIKLTGSSQLETTKGGKFLLTHFAEGKHTLLESDSALPVNAASKYKVEMYRKNPNTPEGSPPENVTGNTNWAPRIKVELKEEGGKLVLTASVDRSKASTLTWTGAVDGNVNGSTMNWRNGNNADFFASEKDSLVFLSRGNEWGEDKNGGNLTFAGDVLKADSITVRGGYDGDPQKYYGFSGAAFELSGANGFSHYSYDNVGWHAPANGGTHKMNKFASNGGGGSSGDYPTLYLFGEHKFAPYSADKQLDMSLGGDSLLYIDGNTVFEQTSAVWSSRAQINRDSTFTFTGKTNFELKDFYEDHTPLRLGAGGYIVYKSGTNSASLRLTADNPSGGTTPTDTVAGENALKFDGTKQEITVYGGGRLMLSQRSVTLEQIKMILDAGALHIRGDVMTIDKEDSLLMHKDSKIVLGTQASNDDLNSSLKIFNSDFSITKKLMLDSDRTMTLTPGADVTLAATTKGAFEGIDFKLQDGTLSLDKDAQITAASMKPNSTGPEYGNLFALENSKATIAANTLDGKVISVLKGKEEFGNKGIISFTKQSELTVESAKGTVLYADSVEFADSKLTAGPSGTVIGGGGVSFTSSSTLDADAASGKVVDVTGNVVFDDSTLTAKTSSSVITAGQNVSFSTSHLNTGDVTEAVVNTGGNVTFTSSGLTGAKSNSVITAGGNVQFTDSKLNTDAVQGKVIDAKGDVRFDDSDLTAKTSDSVVNAGKSVTFMAGKLDSGAVKNTVVNAAGAVTFETKSDLNVTEAGSVIKGSAVTFKGQSSLVAGKINGKVIDASGAVTFDNSKLLASKAESVDSVISAGSVAFTGSELQTGAVKSALIDSKGDVVFTNSKVVSEGDYGSGIAAAGAVKFTGSSIEAKDTKGTLISATDVNFANSSLSAGASTKGIVATKGITFDKSNLSLGAASGVALQADSIVFKNGSTLGLTDLGAKPAVSSNNFTLADSTLKLNPTKANRSAPIIYSKNEPVMTGKNSLDFTAVPNGSFTILTAGIPEDEYLERDKTTATFGDRITVNGQQIKSGGRVEWSGLQIADNGKSIVASAKVDNAVRTWTGTGWKEDDKTVVMGDHLVFDDTASSKTVDLPDAFTASDVDVKTADTYIMKGAELFINGENVKIGGRDGTGTLLKQGSGTVDFSETHVTLQNGKIEEGTLLLGTMSGFSNDNRGTVEVQSKAVLQSGSAGGNLKRYVDVNVQKDAKLVVDSKLEVGTGASLTLQDGAVLDFGLGEMKLGHVVADGFKDDPDTWRSVTFVKDKGIEVAENSRWQARGVASYDKGSMSIANGGALSVSNTGSHKFTGAAELTMAAGSMLHVDLTDREYGLAALDISGQTGTKTLLSGVKLVVSSSKETDGKWLILAGADKLTGSEFTKDILFVDPVTLLPDVNIKAADGNKFELLYDDKEAWLNASITNPGTDPGPDPGPGDDDSRYTQNFNRKRNFGVKPNTRRALRRYTAESFANMAALKSRWYRNGGYVTLGYDKYAFANEIIKNGPNMTPEGMLSTIGHNVQAFRGMTQSFLGNFSAGTPSVASTNSLQFTGMDTPRSAERLLGSFRGARGLQAQAESDKVGNALSGYGNLVATGLETNSLINNWTPSIEATRNMLMGARGNQLNAYGNNGIVGHGVRFFGGYLGSFSNMDSDGGYSGYDSYMNGFMLGAAIDFNEHWSVGGYVAYTTGTTDFNRLDTEVDTDATQVGLALSYKHGNGIRLTGDIGYGHYENDSTREMRIGGVSYSHDGSSDQDLFTVGLGFAYDWNPSGSPATTISPFLELRYTYSDSEGYRESGQILPVRVKGTDSDSFTSSLGITLAHDFMPKENMVLTPRLTLGWLHEYGDDDVRATTNFVGARERFTTRSYETGTDMFQAGASLDFLLLNKNDTAFGVKVMYGMEAGDRGVNQNVYGGFEFRF